MPTLGSLFSAKKVDARLQKNQKLVESMALPKHHMLSHEQIELSEMIGQGGFAKVHRCVLGGQTAVCKLIHAEKLNEEMTYLLTNECTIWARLAHPHIVSFFGMGSTSSNILLLLSNYQQIASGMQYLHELSPPVLHRDLKSANILLADDKQRLAIADFGLARFLEDAGKKMTAETGSYRWMAPEVIRHELYNERCDVYSFAILGWEMLTYKIPFDDLMPVEAAFAVAREARRPTMPSSVPPPVLELLQSCWQQDARMRPSFAEVNAALDREIPIAAAERENGPAV